MEGYGDFLGCTGESGTSPVLLHIPGLWGGCGASGSVAIQPLFFSAGVRLVLSCIFHTLALVYTSDEGEFRSVQTKDR